MTFETRKSDCTDSLASILNRTAGWRKKMAVLHPSDPRNLRSNECLLQLATEATGLTDSEFAALRPYCGWASESWREAVSKAARHVGFTHKIKDFHSFIEHLLGVLAEQSVTA